jgi:hypothetical protein
VRPPWHVVLVLLVSLERAVVGHELVDDALDIFKVAPVAGVEPDGLNPRERDALLIRPLVRT